MRCLSLEDAASYEERVAYGNQQAERVLANLKLAAIAEGIRWADPLFENLSDDGTRHFEWQAKHKPASFQFGFYEDEGIVLGFAFIEGRELPADGTFYTEANVLDGYRAFILASGET